MRRRRPLPGQRLLGCWALGRAVATLRVWHPCPLHFRLPVGHPRSRLPGRLHLGCLPGQTASGVPARRGAGSCALACEPRAAVTARTPHAPHPTPHRRCCPPRCAAPSSRAARTAQAPSASSCRSGCTTNSCGERRPSCRLPACALAGCAGVVLAARHQATIHLLLAVQCATCAAYFCTMRGLNARLAYLPARLQAAGKLRQAVSSRGAMPQRRTVLHRRMAVSLPLAAHDALQARRRDNVQAAAGRCQRGGNGGLRRHVHAGRGGEGAAADRRCRGEGRTGEG